MAMRLIPIGLVSAMLFSGNASAVRLIQLATCVPKIETLTSILEAGRLRNEQWRKTPPRGDEEDTGLAILAGLSFARENKDQKDLNWFYPMWGTAKFLGDNTKTDSKHSVRPICLAFEFDLDHLNETIYKKNPRFKAFGFFRFYEHQNPFVPAENSVYAVTPFDIDLQKYLRRVYIPDDISLESHAQFNKLKKKWESEHMIEFVNFDFKSPPDIRVPFPHAQ